MDNRFFQDPTTKEDLPVLKHKRLDLRHQEDYRKFMAKKFVFQVNTPQPINITEHSYTSNRESEHIHSSIEAVIREGLETIQANGVSQRAVIQIYLHASGLDQDFIMNAVGHQRMTLGSMLRDHHIEELVNRWSLLIQSGRKVMLDNKSVLTIMSYEPPMTYS
jgi:ketopantoate reductase